MNSIGQLKQQVLDYIARKLPNGDLHGAKVTAEFPGGSRAVPLKSPLIVVGVEAVELADGGLGGYYGSGGSGGIYGKTAVVTLFFDIHCPPEAGGATCHQIYEALCDTLLLGDAPFGFVKLWCGDIGYDKVSLGNRLRAGASLRGAVTHTDTALRVREFHIRRKEDGNDR